MKHIKTLAVVVAGSLVAGGLAIAQVQGGGASGHDEGKQHGDLAAVVKHLAEVFPKIAAFDANKDGKLDEKEKESLAKAISDGKLELAAHHPPNGGKPNVEVMVNHIGDMFPQVVRYDANHDGVLDETEQAAIKSAIEKGQLDFSHGEHSPGHGDANH
jgi:hypothetical protein